MENSHHRLYHWFIMALLFIFCLHPVSTQAKEIDKSVASGLEDSKTLKVGMEANYAPFNWTQTDDSNGAVPISNSSGEYANGYDVQIARKLADKLGVKLEIVKLEWDGLPPALESGKIDAIIAGMSPTEERLKQMDFTNSYYNSDIVLVVDKDSPYASANNLDDFANAKVTGQLNTFHYDLIDQIPNVNKQTALEAFPTMISSVMSGKIDAYISERPGAMSAIAANPDLTYVSFDDNKGFDLKDVTTEVAVGLRKDSPLVDPINDALDTISNDEREDTMEDMVDLNEQDEDRGFLGDISNIWSKYGSQFLRGAGNTMFIALTSTIIGSLIGLIIAIIRSIKVAKTDKIKYVLYKIIDFIIVAYIEIFRGTPMMVQAMLIFYGSKLFFDFDLSSMAAALLIVSVNTGAYLSEVIRGGITGIDKGQTEADKEIGMNHFQTMTSVILPQAIRTTLPALGNEFVINIKDTSVLNVIAVTELFFITKSTAGSTYLTFQTFLIASIIYFVLTFTSTRILNWVEKKFNDSDTYRIHTSSTIPE